MVGGVKAIILLLVVVCVGCASTPTKETTTATTKKPDPPKTTIAKTREIKPLTKEESAKIIEAEIRYELNKPIGELTKADWEKVTKLGLYGKELTEVPKGLEKLAQLTEVNLTRNQLTSVKGLEKLTKLKWLKLSYNKLTSVKGLEKLTQLK